MDRYIKISNINDFTFCPHSIYLHRVYESFHENLYKDIPQLAGKAAHTAIDTKAYSSRKRYLCGLVVYSEQLGLLGKIDLYDKEDRALIERKRMLRYLYDGNRFQLFAQYYCMQEMGYPVAKLYIHSLADNKRHPIEIPKDADKQRLFDIIAEIRSYAADVARPKVSKNKCVMCIYRQLCSHSNVKSA